MVLRTTSLTEVVEEENEFTCKYTRLDILVVKDAGKEEEESHLRLNHNNFLFLDVVLCVTLDPFDFLLTMFLSCFFFFSFFPSSWNVCLSSLPTSYLLSTEMGRLPTTMG
jgi:hypothetical protein